MRLVCDCCKTEIEYGFIEIDAHKRLCIEEKRDLLLCEDCARKTNE